jgi:hypothetical protein
MIDMGNLDRKFRGILNYVLQCQTWII